MEQKKGKSIKKLPYLFGALVLALTITGSLFAYTYTTASITLGMAAYSDIATVEPTDYDAGGKVFGKYKGDLPAGDLFEIDPNDDYTGDLTVKVSIMNPGELAHAYQYFNMKLALTRADGTPIIGTGVAPTGYQYQCLSLQNGVVEFDVVATLSHPYHVKLVDGGFCTYGRSPLPWASPFGVDPGLFCEVVARK